jgi:GxxExxY protein
MKNTDLTDKKNTDQTDKPKLLYEDLCYRVIGCIYDVRNEYGSGQKELVYQNALAETLHSKNIPFCREEPISIKSHLTGKILGKYRLDFVVNQKIIIELKAMKFTPDKIQNQLYSYLYSTLYEIGYLVNFGSTRLYLKRVILTNDRKMIR